MAVAGVVILYHPDETVRQNIQSYLPYVDRLFIADNTEDAMSIIARTMQADDKVTIIWNGSNEGIAKRLNEAATMAISEGCNWLLTMDQDSCFEDNNMADYMLCAGGYLYKDNTAMFGVKHETKSQDKTECEPLLKNKIITSGSILNLNLFDAVGLFDEKLFIDDVDFDYCYRARLKGYQIVQFANIFLNHELGKSSYHKSLKSFRLTHRSLHSPERIYYMVRNYLYTRKRYKEAFPEDVAEERNALMNRIKNNLLYNNKRGKVLLAVGKAVRGYLANQ